MRSALVRSPSSPIIAVGESKMDYRAAHPAHVGFCGHALARTAAGELQRGLRHCLLRRGLFSEPAGLVASAGHAAFDQYFAQPLLLPCPGLQWVYVRDTGWLRGSRGPGQNVEGDFLLAQVARRRPAWRASLLSRNQYGRLDLRADSALPEDPRRLDS